MIYNYQRGIYEKLRLTAKAKAIQHQLPPCPIKPRLHRLIIGPSGTGKTHIARNLAEELDWPCLVINVSAWIILGARETSTWSRIVDFYKNNYYEPNYLIVLDELDKIWGMDSWTRYLRVEVFSLLDGLLPVGVGSEDIDVHAIERRMRNTLVVGAGAFQDAFDEPDSMGFIPQKKDPKSSNDLAKHIPREVVNRFDSNLLIMPELTKEDYYDMLQEMEYNLPDSMAKYIREYGPGQIDSALRDKSSARWAENLYAEALYSQVDTLMPPPAPFNPDEIPLI